MFESNIFRTMILIFVLGILFMLVYTLVFSDEVNGRNKGYTACYVCEDGTFVKYKGEDSYFKRREAMRRYDCKVVKRVWECDTDRIVKDKRWKYWQKAL